MDVKDDYGEESLADDFDRALGGDAGHKGG